MNANEKAVADVLAKYEDALNHSDTDAVMRLYATDGVFMPQNSPSSVGADAVRKAYDAVFRAIKLTVKFNVAEVVEMAPDWVFARTNSAGQSGTLRIPEDRRCLEDRALLLRHYEPTTSIRFPSRDDLT